VRAFCFSASFARGGQAKGSESVYFVTAHSAAPVARKGRSLRPRCCALLQVTALFLVFYAEGTTRARRSDQHARSCVDVVARACANARASACRARASWWRVVGMWTRSDVYAGNPPQRIGSGL